MSEDQKMIAVLIGMFAFTVAAMLWEGRWLQRQLADRAETAANLRVGRMRDRDLVMRRDERMTELLDDPRWSQPAFREEATARLRAMLDEPVQDTRWGN